MSPPPLASLNRNLHTAKNKKDDEFYTQLTDIANELQYYEPHFEGGTVYCNCDDPTVSNFVQYFAQNFHRLKLKRLIGSCYKSKERDMFSKHDSKTAIWYEYNGEKKGNAPLKGKPKRASQNFFVKDGDVVHSLYGRIFIRNKELQA